MSKLTKQAIKRLKDAEVTVKLFNGCFNVAKCSVRFSRYTLELRVSVTHKELAWQCGDKNEVELVYWKGCTGEIIRVPEELREKVQVMQKLATMTDEEAKRLSDQNKLIFTEGMKELGIVV